MIDPYDEHNILAYVEGEMPAAQQHEFKLALLKDTQLRQLVEQIVADRDALRAMPQEPAPAELMERVTQRLERSMLLGSAGAAQGRFPGGVSHRIQRRMTLMRLGALAAMAAVLLLAAGLFYHSHVQMREVERMNARRLAIADKTDSAPERVAREADVPESAGRTTWAPAATLSSEANRSDADGQVDMMARSGDEKADPQHQARANAEVMLPPTAPLEPRSLANAVGETPQAASARTSSPTATATPDDAVMEALGRVMFFDGPVKVGAASTAADSTLDLMALASMAPITVEPAADDMLLAKAEQDQRTAIVSNADPAHEAPTAALAAAPSGLASRRPPALLITSHEPDHTLRFIENWAREHDAVVMAADTVRPPPVDPGGLLPAAPSRPRRMTIRLKSSQLPAMIDLLNEQRLTHATLVAELPRPPLRTRRVATDDAARDTYADTGTSPEPTSIDPATLAERREVTMTLQILIRPPEPAE